MNLLAQVRLILRNDLRLLWRESRTGILRLAGRFGVLGLVLVAGHLFTFLLFSQLRDWPPLGIEAGIWAFFGFAMLGISMNTIIRMFFERADFDLLLASPLNPRAVLLARLTTMTTAAFLSVALFLLPLLNGIIIGFSARYFGGYAVWLLLAASVASLGSWLTLSLVRWLGPARARTWVQILAALLGTLVYLSFQVQAFLPPEDRTVYLLALRDVVDSAGLSAIARAGRGSALDLLALAGGAAIIVALTTRQLARTFLSGLQEANVKASRKPARANRYRFTDNLSRATFRKDTRLILRDPLLLTHVLPSAMYIIPAFFAFRKFGSATMLAPVAVVIATQFSALLTEIAAAGEECLDLIRMSPSPEIRLRRAKMAAGMALPVVLAFLVSVVVGYLATWVGGAVTFATAFGTAAGCAWLHVTRIEPTPRKDLLSRKRRRSSFGRDFAVGALMMCACTGVALFVKETYWWLGLGFLGLTALGVIACFVLATVQEAEPGPSPT